MDWGSFFGLVIYGMIVGGPVYWMGWNAHKKHIKNPYSWSCPAEDCFFEVSSNQQDLTIRMADSHEEAFHSL